jgi:D-3-phosphoglycerate dehydrogenase
VGSFTDSEINIFKKDGLSVRIKSIFEEKYWKDVGLLVLGEGIHIPDEILEKAVKLKVIGLQNPNQNRLNEELCTRRGIVVFKGSGKGEKKGKGTMERILVRMIDFINKGSTLGSSNFPNIHLPPSKSAHRLLHIHHNIPGIIAQINLVMARHHLNIEAQILKTNPDLGYVITDVNSKYDQAVLSDLKKIDQTIKFRILY